MLTEAALQLYRQRYAMSSLYDATPYPTMLEVLQQRVADGARLILCTAKPKIFAERVVEHFGFASLLSAVYGPELDGRFDDKGDLIEHLLATAHIPTVKLERMTFAFAALDAAGLTRDDSISCVGLRMASALQY